MEIGFEYEDIFSEDERALFENTIPTTEKMRRLKELNRNIRLAVAEDTVEGYNLAAKLLKAKNKLINIQNTETSNA